MRTANHHKRKAGMLGLLIAVGMALACSNIPSSGEDKPRGVAAIRNFTPEVSREVSLGESVTVGDLDVSVSGVRATDGRDSDLRVPAPPDGYVYLLVNVMLKNTGDESEHMSSRMRMSLLDSEGKTQEWALFPAAAGSIDGRIGPGSERKGELTWRVKENAVGLKMVFGDVAFSIGDASGYWPGPPDNKLSVNN